MPVTLDDIANAALEQDSALVDLVKQYGRPLEDEARERHAAASRRLVAAISAYRRQPAEPEPAVCREPRV